MSYYNYVNSNQTFTLLPEDGSRRPDGPPRGLIATKAVQTRDGHLGQVFVDGDIVWESAHRDTAEEAQQEANATVIQAVKKLFTG